MSNPVVNRGNYGANVVNKKVGTFSPFIWHDCPVREVKEGRIRGSIVEQLDWADWPLSGTQTTQIGFSKYKVFATADGVIVPQSVLGTTERVGSILTFTAGTTSDNESLSLAQAYPSFLLNGLPGSTGKLWFEAELGLTSLATNTVGFFAGLAETELWTLATGVPFNGGDAITNSASAIGFRKGEDALGVVDTVVSDRATSFTNIGDDEGLISAVNTLHKFGMTYDPNQEARCVRFYQDGVELPTAITRTALKAYTNLDANALGVIFAMICDSAADGVKLLISKFRCVQVAP